MTVVLRSRSSQKLFQLTLGNWSLVARSNSWCWDGMEWAQPLPASTGNLCSIRRQTSARNAICFYFLKVPATRERKREICRSDSFIKILRVPTQLKQLSQQSFPRFVRSCNIAVTPRQVYHSQHYFRQLPASFGTFF